MKIKFLSSSYIDGCSTVILEYDNQTFVGYANLHPDDIDRASEFTGCEIAELRARVKIIKYIISKERQRLIAIKDLRSKVINSKYINDDTLFIIDNDIKYIQKKIDRMVEKARILKNQAKCLSDVKKKQLENFKKNQEQKQKRFEENIKKLMKRQGDING